MVLLSIGMYHIAYKGVPTWCPDGQDKDSLAGKLELSDYRIRDGKVKLNIYTPIAGWIKLRILNPRGKEILRQKMHADSGMNALALDSAQFGPEGNYTLNLATNEDQIIQSLRIE